MLAEDESRDDFHEESNLYPNVEDDINPDTMFTKKESLAKIDAIQHSFSDEKNNNLNQTTPEPVSNFDSMTLNEDEILEITVEDPQEVNDLDFVGVSRSHIEYLVEAKKGIGGQLQSSCRRRYNNFEWLRQSLVVANPSLVIPPLPGTQLTVLKDDKIRHRWALLTRFLQKIAHHRILSKDPAFANFLQGDPALFHQPVSTGPVNSLRPSGGSKQNADDFISNEFSKNTNLASCIWTIDNGEVRIANTKYSLRSDLQSLKSNISALPNHEINIKASCDAFAKGIEDYGVLVDEHNEKNIEDFVIPLTEVRLTANAALRTINYHDDIIILREMLSAQIDKKTMEKSAIQSGDLGLSFAKLFGKNEETIKQEKLYTVEAEIRELERRKNEADQLLERESIVTRRELEEWNAKRIEKSQTLLATYVDNQVDFHSKSVDLFKNLLNELEV